MLLGPPRSPAGTKKAFRSEWPQQAERPWARPEYWTNPLEDWRIETGRLECICPGGDRNVFLLTREVAARKGTLDMSVRLGRIEGSAGMHGQASSGQCPFHSVRGGVEDGAKKLDGSFAGFRVGIKSFLDDYRARTIHDRG